MKQKIIYITSLVFNRGSFRWRIQIVFMLKSSQWDKIKSIVGSFGQSNRQNVWEFEPNTNLTASNILGWIVNHTFFLQDCQQNVKHYVLIFA